MSATRSSSARPASGKSFTLNFLLVQALQYNPRVLILDLGGSYRWITRFLGGGYLELSPDDATGHGGFRLRPFALPRTERSVQFLTGWIMRLLRIGGWTVSGSDPSEIRARIEDLYAFPPARRTMTVFVHSLAGRHVAGDGALVRPPARGAGTSTTRPTATTLSWPTGT